MMIVLKTNCLFYRFAGSILSITSIFTIILTFRYFVRRCQKGLPLSPILLGMLISLILILCTGIPVVLIQCFTCQPLKTYIEICKINAFICFSVGTFNMYMLVLLSIFRYINIVHKHSTLSRFVEHYRGLNVIICALISFCWSIPPLLNIGNTYKDEGIGFYCSLDWNNSAFQSRLFLYTLIICNYFLLLIILIYTNLRVYFVLRYLLKSNQGFNSSSNLIYHLNLDPNLRKHVSDRQLKRKLNRLQRLKMDRRYAFITIIMVSQFIISSTPYVILALMIINGKIELIRRYPIFSTAAELLAKFSLILNPLILIYTSKMRQHS